MLDRDLITSALASGISRVGQLCGDIDSPALVLCQWDGLIGRRLQPGGRRAQADSCRAGIQLAEVQVAAGHEPVLAVALSGPLLALFGDA